MNTQYFSHTNIIYSLDSSWWVPLCYCSVSPLLILPVVYFLECECVCWVSLFVSCSHCMSSAFQEVSASMILLYFPLPTLPVLCVPGGESLCLVSLFLSCSLCPFSAFQSVGAPSVVLCFSHANIVLHLLSSGWVPLPACFVSFLLTLFYMCSLEGECLCLVVLFLSCWHCFTSAI